MLKEMEAFEEFAVRFQEAVLILEGQQRGDDPVIWAFRSGQGGATKEGPGLKRANRGLCRRLEER